MFAIITENNEAQSYKVDMFTKIFRKHNEKIETKFQTHVKMVRLEMCFLFLFFQNSCEIIFS